MASALAISKGDAPRDADLARKILDLVLPDKREAALLHLSKHREIFPNLAPMLWWSVGTMSALLQEIVAIYPALTPPTLTAQASNRVCNALALLQCVASHPDTRRSFLEGEVILGTNSPGANCSLIMTASSLLHSLAVVFEQCSLLPQHISHSTCTPSSVLRRLKSHSSTFASHLLESLGRLSRYDVPRIVLSLTSVRDTNLGR